MLNVMGRIIRWTGGYKRRLYIGFVYSFLQSVFIAIPIMLAAAGLSMVLDDFSCVKPFEMQTVWLILAAMIAAVLGRFLFSYLRATTQESIAYERTAEERLELGDILKRVSLGFFSENNAGELNAAVTTDLSFMEMFAMNMVNTVVNGYIGTAVFILCIAFYSWPIALIALAGVLLSMVFLNLLQRYSRKNATLHQKAQDDMVESSIEFLRGMSVVKAFKQEGASVEGIRRAYRSSKKINIRIEMEYMPCNYLYLFTLKIASVAIVLASGLLALSGAMPLPTMLMFSIFSFMLFSSTEIINNAAHVLEIIDATLTKLDRWWTRGTSCKKAPIRSWCGRTACTNGLSVSGSRLRVGVSHSINKEKAKLSLFLHKDGFAFLRLRQKRSENRKWHECLHAITAGMKGMRIKVQLAQKRPFGAADAVRMVYIKKVIAVRRFSLQHMLAKSNYLRRRNIMQAVRSERKLKGKDLITIGIFSAIYFVINFAFMLAGGIHPVMWILMPGFIALFTGIPYMLMAVKVQKPGAVLLMGVITGLIYFATGQFTVLILIFFAVGCGLAELTRYITKYEGLSGTLLSFVFFSLGMIGSPIAIWVFKESFFAQITEQGMPVDYVATLQALTSNTMLIVLIAAPMIGAVIGGMIAKGMFRKHFTKAGIV